VTAQAGELLPGLATVGGVEQGGIFDAGINGVGIVQRRLEVPYSLELPGVRRAVVPLVGAGHAVVLELVAHGPPRLAAVARSLDLLAEPAARLRCINPIRINRLALQMVELPACEMRSANIPLLAAAF